MVDPLPCILSCSDRIRGLSSTTKKNSLIVLLILVLGAGVFFSVFFDSNVYAEKNNSSEVIKPEIVDPLNRIGKGFVSHKKENSILVGKDTEEDLDLSNPGKIGEMIEGYPMEEMTDALNKRDPEVASFLVAIAKKESNWGKYSPTKEGRDCYNYWGYRGTYNQTKSGYSCFDSPEHAVQVVGDRIENLLSKQIDTAEKMIVWKCGSSCASHDPEGVRKWIADVNFYYKKLNS